ncbi:hypothetical protein IFR05_016067, partial [Cadophora sp. M221]
MRIDATVGRYRLDRLTVYHPVTRLLHKQRRSVSDPSAASNLLEPRAKGNTACLGVAGSVAGSRWSL